MSVRIRRWCPPILSVSAGLLALASLSSAQTTKLAGPFAPGPGGGDALELRVSADGTRVVYRADEETYGVFELFTAPADGSAPAVKLSVTPVENGDVTEGGFAFSPDGSRVLYLAEQDADGVIELYSVPSDGSAAPVKLNAPLPLGGDVGVEGKRGFEFSTDGTRVVYRADQAVDQQYGLWSVPIDGSAAPVKISGSAFAMSGTSIQVAAADRVLFAGFNVTDGFEILSAPFDGSSAPLMLTSFAGSTTTGVAALPPGGSQALVMSAQTSPQDQRLWIVPVDGSAAPTLLTPTVIKLIGDVRISPDGTRALYLASSTGAFEFELFSVPLDGSASPVRLHAPLPAGRSVLVQKNDITSDSARALFVADISANDVFELWSAPIDGSASPIRLNDALAPGTDVTGVFGTPLVSASERVVFQAASEVFSVPADGSGAALKLNAPLPPLSGIVPYSNDLENPAQPFGSDTTKVVFLLSVYDGFQDSVEELYSVPIDASAAPVKLNGTLTGGGDVAAELGWRFAGARVAFFADQDTDDVFELFSAPLGGGPGRVKLNGPMASSPPGSSFANIQFTPDGSRALYTFQLGEGGGELFSVPTDGSAEPVRLHPSLPAHHSITSYEISADGERVVFVDFDDGTFGTGGADLHSAPTDGSGPATAFDAAANSGAYALTPDGAHVITRGEDQRLYRAPIDASAPGVALTSALPTAQTIRRFVITPDSGTVVFAQDRDVAGVVELYKVPVAGGPTTKLNPSLVANGDVGWPDANTFVVLVSPDSARVVYLADQDVDERFELYSAPLAGGAVTKLNGSLVSGGDVLATSTDGPRISPDGARVVYLADQLVDSRYELFGVPLLGGTAVKLSGTLVANGNVDPTTPFQIDSTSQRVVYRADAAVDERFELYSAPLAGGTAVRLNGDLVLHGDVQPGIRLSPDGTRVVFFADQEVDAQNELYSRRIDGSGRLVKLNAPLPAGGALGSAEISADSRRVVFSGDQLVDERYELYKVPLTGGPIHRLNEPLVAGGDVFQFTLSPDGSFVVHAGDQETDEMSELFATPLVGGGTGPSRGAASAPAGGATVGPVDAP